MTDRRLLDTNLIIRHLVQDDVKHARIAGRLFEACDREEISLVVFEAVLAECVFVLESFYRFGRDEIAVTLTSLIGSPGIEIANGGRYLDALKRYRVTNLHFVDCVLAAAAAGEDVPVATFDRGFRKFADVRVWID